MFMIFCSPVLQMSDSQYSMLTAESIIHNHTPDLLLAVKASTRMQSTESIKPKPQR